jgi:hypothetical protein
VKCKVAGVVPFIVMKGMAIGRGKPKDAYDIEFAIANYPAGIIALIEEFKSDIENPLIVEGLGRIRTKFQSPDHTGPDDIARFLEIDEPEAKAFRKRLAFENVVALLDGLGINRIV